MMVFMSHLPRHYGTASGHVPNEQHRSVAPRYFRGPQPPHCSRRRYARRNNSRHKAQSTLIFRKKREGGKIVQDTGVHDEAEMDL